MRHPRAALLCVVCLAVAVRIAACVAWFDDLTHDRDVYLGLAQGLVDGRGFSSPGTTSPTAYRPPLYPLCLALGLLVTSPALAVAGVNVLAGVVTVLAAWWLARFLRLSSTREGEAPGEPLRAAAPIHRSGSAGASPSPESSSAWVAALLVAVDPLLVRYTVQPMTECVFTALVLLALSVSCRLLSGGNRPVSSRVLIALSTGLLLGLAALCRPTVWPFVGLASVFTLVVQRRERRLAVLSFLSLWAGVLLAVSPWVVRNAVVLGEPKLTTTHGGYTLLLANNPVFYDEVARQPWGTVWSRDSLETWQRGMLAKAAAELGPSPGEIATDRWQAAQAWRNIRHDRSGFAAAAWYRVRSLWSLSPRGDLTGGPVQWLIAAWYAGLFVAAGLGFWRLWRRDVVLATVFVLLIGSVQAVHLLYWTDTRMRAPLHPAFAVLAAALYARRSRGVSPRSADVSTATNVP